MKSAFLGLLEYLLVIGFILVLAVVELVSLLRTQRRDLRIRKGSSERTHTD